MRNSHLGIFASHHKAVDLCPAKAFTKPKQRTKIMYPFIRLPWQFFKHRNDPALPPTGVHVSQHICWPWDLELPWFYLEISLGKNARWWPSTTFLWTTLKLWDIFHTGSCTPEAFTPSLDLLWESSLDCAHSAGNTKNQRWIKSFTAFLSVSNSLPRFWPSGLV